MRQNQFQIRVNWGDTDKAGIVYYPNYFKWFDIAGHQFFRSAGLSPAELADKQQIILPLLDARCTFEKPLYYDDIITIKTRVEEIHRKTIKLSHEVYRDEERTGYGYELRGWVKEEDGKIFAVPIPDEVKDLLLKEREKENLSVNPWLSA
ncbi:acyl-CoA thioesterase [Thermoactinomyces mirandus]|uniref:Acyl-CoA thioesterase n=1 Tax=Thermoactinomyces mirandus TaxID=2756294 RepID=A0A7W2AS95_9BACL|nr:thioesterase family protein [Thermoactinomyces mirandus]MBA4603829.1 acyl-CoA thioesterase [Thermoactinomyces mirandus]